MGNMRCVVFDFDGVLVDSNAIKRNAYFTIFHEVDPEGRTVREALIEAQGGIRHQVIAAIVRRLQMEGRLDSHRALRVWVAQYAGKYNRICERAVAQCPEIPGASECLRKLTGRCLLYINSATLEEPLRRVVRKRGWTRYFRAVLGSSRTKVENLRWIRQDAGVERSAMVFVGDQSVDLDAARACGCPFIGVRSSGGEPLADWVPIVEDLSAVPGLIDVGYTRGASDGERA